MIDAKKISFIGTLSTIRILLMTTVSRRSTTMLFLLTSALATVQACSDWTPTDPATVEEFEVTPFATVPADVEVEVVGLNDRRQAVWNVDGEAVLWDDGPTPLPLTAQDLRSSGEVLGSADGRVVLWEGGVVADLGAGTPKGLTADGRAFFGTPGGEHFWRHPDGSLEEFTGPLPPLDDGVDDFVEIHVTTEGGRVLSTSRVAFERPVVPCYVTSGNDLSAFPSQSIPACQPVDGEGSHVLANVLTGDFAGHIESFPNRSAGEGPARGNDLNGSAWIVGEALASNNLDSGMFPTLFRNDTVYALESLVRGDWRLRTAGSINNRNEILAIADSPSGDRMIVLLQPFR